MLYVVPTPIGNLEDVTLRSLRLFKTCQTVITEDSRHTRKLFDLLKIENKPKFIDITRNHNLNWHGVNQELDSLLSNQNEVLTKAELGSTKDGLESQSQESVSQENFLNNQSEQITLLVTDAGTPGISDPGFEILQMALEKGLKFEVLPGANGIIPAVVCSGIVSKEFLFLGFLPIKKGRQTAWQKISISEYPVVIYESVHRIEKFITESKVYLEPNRKITVCKDLSKLFENIWRGSIADLDNYKPTLKGEFIVVIGGAD
ncbi:MAG: 16S rRNA (cytidine(1402)-2'-O)-methyltransferase [bacterium]